VFVALAALALGTVMTGLFSSPWHETLWMLPTVLAYFGGRMARTAKKGGGFWAVVGLALALGLSALGLLNALREAMLVTWLLALASWRWGRQDSGGAPMACALFLWMAALLLSRRLDWPSPYDVAAGYGALATALLSVILLAIQGAKRSVYGGSESRVPKPVRRRVLQLSGILLAVALVLALIPVVRSVLRGGVGLTAWLVGSAFGGVTTVISGILEGIMNALVWLAHAFTSLSTWLRSWDAPITNTGSWFVLKGVELPELPWTVLAVLVRLLVLAMLVALLWALFTGGLRLVKQAKTLVRKKPAVQPEDYTEQVRREFSTKKLAQRAGETLRRLRRPPKLSDFPDGEGKIRFAFAQWLRRCVDDDPRARTATPDELRAQTGQDTLTDYYDRIRYGCHPAPDDAEQVAKEALKALK
jgi:hypothetical protein